MNFLLARHSIHGGVPRQWTLVLTLLLMIWLSPNATVLGWGGQGHRVIGRLAESRLNQMARQRVRELLGEETLADVGDWADDFRGEITQTAAWHYVNIPLTAASYDRNRDCPRQPGVAAGSRDDRWRDCLVDRILYSQQLLGDERRDRTEHATALKFLVHLLADVHQPFHTIPDGRGGTDVPVIVFGSATCGGNSTYACNLHSVWDATLIARRKLNDAQYVKTLESLVGERSLATRPIGTPETWALESRDLARAALVPPNGSIDERYYRTQIAVIDERLALAGVRLATILNQLLGR